MILSMDPLRIVEFSLLVKWSVGLGLYLWFQWHANALECVVLRNRFPYCLYYTSLRVSLRKWGFATISTICFICCSILNPLFLKNYQNPSLFSLEKNGISYEGNYSISIRYAVPSLSTLCSWVLFVFFVPYGMVYLPIHLFTLFLIDLLT